MMATHYQHSSQAAAVVARQRSHPVPGQEFYLILQDLSVAIKRVAAEVNPQRILDYGCGSSPYRPYFGEQVKYVRADLAQVDGIDYVVCPGEPLAAPDAEFDFILSTQTLEHVADPLAYLRDCHRMLKPGGRVLITTHGCYPDHGGPYDFQRWTPWGIRRDLEAAGLEAESVWRLTCGPRAVLQFWEMVMERTPASWGSITGAVVRLLRGLTRRFRASIHRWADSSWPSYALCDEERFRHEYSLYIDIVAVAKKAA